MDDDVVRLTARVDQLEAELVALHARRTDLDVVVLAGPRMVPPGGPGLVA